MINKKNFKQRLENFLVKKVFSENYYPKTYIRKNFLDTHNSLYNYKKNARTGFSIFQKIYTYSHIQNNKFTFNSFLNKKNLQTKMFITNLYSSLLMLKKSNNFFFLLLNPVKGGFVAYFSGTTGFIPVNNILFFTETVILKLKKKYFLSFIYSSVNINKTFSCFRVFVDFIKIKIILFSKKKNFSNVKKIKSRRFLFNSVFLLKKNT